MNETLPPAAYVAWAVIGAAYGGIWVWLGVRLCNRRERWVPWTAGALALTSALYVISSGPLTRIAFRRQVTTTVTRLPNGAMGVEATSETNLGEWFPIAYAPLLWASEQPWGDPIFWYWEQFQESG